MNIILNNRKKKCVNNMSTHMNNIDKKELRHKITTIKGYTKKVPYNKTLDEKMVKCFNLDLTKEYILNEFSSPRL